jgi:DNA ligase-associated metallophosphoesterase
VTSAVNGVYSLSFLNQTLRLLPQKAIFWQEKKILLIADVHLGKVNHFRKAGIAIPQIVTASDYTTLEALLNQHPVEEVIFLGDLFHSKANKACEEFADWLIQYPQIRFTLVKGNHDILPDTFFHATNITVYTDTLISSPFILSHIPLREKTSYYNLAGHLHPAVKLLGKGKQLLTLPCFCFEQTTGILPAFGSFTGNAIISPGPESMVFAIAGMTVCSLS